MKSNGTNLSEPQEPRLEGGAKIGWFCSYTPLEVLYAAGLSPFRVTGHSDAIQKADSFMHPNMCQYVRSCLDTALAGGYSHLQGAVFVNSCDAMRRLYDAWRKYVTPDFIHIMDLPRGRSDSDCTYFLNEIFKLKDSLQRHFGAEIQDAALARAARALAESRSVYHSLNRLRKETPPRLSGKEMMELVSLFFRTDQKSWNRVARARIQQAGEETPAQRNRPRVLLSGSPINNPEIAGFIESCGLEVVYDDMCTGSRFFDMQSDVIPETWQDLSRACMNKPPCARMLMIDERVERTIRIAQEFRAHGIIHHCLKFCDTYLYDMPQFKYRLNRAGLRVLTIEGDCTLGSMGQLKTRIEAFAEVLDNP